MLTEQSRVDSPGPDARLLVLLQAIRTSCNRVLGNSSSPVHLRGCLESSDLVLPVCPAALPAAAQSPARDTVEQPVVWEKLRTSVTEMGGSRKCRA